VKVKVRVKVKVKVRVKVKVKGKVRVKGQRKGSVKVKVRGKVKKSGMNPPDERNQAGLAGELALRWGGFTHSDHGMFKRMLPRRETQARFVRFLTVGGLAAGVQFASLALLKRHLGPSLSFTLSFVLSTSTHYLCNRFWALPSDRRDPARQFVEYLATAALSYLINISLFKLGLNLLGLGVMGSAILALPPSTLLVFLLLNYRVFRRGVRQV
jgi:putative flippase GtrA